MRKVAAAVALGLAALAPGVAPSSASSPPGSTSCPDFPADSFWHADVRNLPVHPRSDAWLANMGGATRRLHPDFGDSGGPQPYGIPYAIVGAEQQKVRVDFEYADESDPGPYPFGPDVPVEGGSDRHALMVDRDSCTLYELFAADWNGGSPTAGSGAVFDLRSNALRPVGWTSADAAGLPIFPGLLRRDEVLAGRIDHPIRMTAQRTDRSFVWPARHQAGAARDANLPPMGAWFRMRPDYPTDGLHPYTKVIVEAFKTYGLILADNGSNWYFTGAADAGWEPRVLNELKALTAGAFEAVDTSSLMSDPDSGAVRGRSTPPTSSAPPPPTPAAPATTVAAAPAPTSPPTTAPPNKAVPTRATTSTTTVDVVAPIVEEAPSTTTSTSTTSTTTPTTDTSSDGPDSVAVDVRRTPGGRKPPWFLLGVPIVAAFGVAMAYRHRHRRHHDRRSI